MLRLAFQFAQKAAQVGRRQVSHDSSIAADATTSSAASAAGRKAGIIAFTIMVGTTVGLGSWQLSRYNWKTDVIAARKKALEQAPLDISSLPLGEVPQPDKDSLQLVKVSGVLDLSRATVLTPRPPPKGLPDAYVRATNNAGALVVAPLERADGSEILVMRGWYPRNEAPPAGKQAVELTGILRSSEEPGSWAIAQRPEANEFSWLEIPAIAAHVGLRPTPTPTPAAAPASSSLETPVAASGAPAAAAAAAPSSGPIVMVEAVDPLPSRPGQYPLTKQMASLADTYVMPHTHLIYAGTWYTLAAFGGMIAWYRFKRRVRAPLRAPGTAGAAGGGARSRR